jgi:hypothetical protein
MFPSLSRRRRPQKKPMLAIWGLGGFKLQLTVPLQLTVLFTAWLHPSNPPCALAA